MLPYFTVSGLVNVAMPDVTGCYGGSQSEGDTKRDKRMTRHLTFHVEVTSKDAINAQMVKSSIEAVFEHDDSLAAIVKNTHDSDKGSFSYTSTVKECSKCGDYSRGGDYMHVNPEDLSVSDEAHFWCYECQSDHWGGQKEGGE
jgi:uncharacterized protein with PIN domain